MKPMRLKCKIRIARALEESIEHWEENVYRAREGRLGAWNIDADSCALCVTCADISDVTRKCEICPVGQETGHYGCVGSPYTIVCDLLTECPDNYDSILEAAEAELEFLENLKKEMDMDV